MDSVEMNKINAGMSNTYEIDGKAYPVVGTVKNDKLGEVPLLGVRMMSDLEWLHQCLKSRLENPEIYQGIDDDVNVEIERLRRTINEYKTAAPVCQDF